MAVPPKPDAAEVLRRMEAYKWQWADKDRTAYEELEFRVIRKARQKPLENFLSYSELVEGVVFHLPNVNDGKPYRIDTRNWKDLDRAIIGDFLGLISTNSWRNHGFMLSAMVIGQNEGQPSPQFFKWMRELKLLDDLSEDSVIRFWKSQYKAAHTDYAYPKKG